MGNFYKSITICVCLSYFAQFVWPLDHCFFFTHCQPAYSSASFSDGTRLLCHKSLLLLSLCWLVFAYELKLWVVLFCNCCCRGREGLSWFWPVSAGLRKVHNSLSWILQRGAVAFSFPLISALNNCDFGYNIGAHQFVLFPPSSWSMRYVIPILAWFLRY